MHLPEHPLKRTVSEEVHARPCGQIWALAIPLVIGLAWYGVRPFTAPWESEQMGVKRPFGKTLPRHKPSRWKSLLKKEPANATHVVMEWLQP